MNFQTTYQGGQLDRALAKSLPCLPGYSFNLNIGADRFHKPSQWEFNRGIPVLSEVEGYRPRRGIGEDVPERRPRPGIGGLLPPPWAPVKTGPDYSIYPRTHGTCRLPTWMEFDKKVLSFDAYYQEPIPESGLENYRVHQCKIYFYLEDDTVQVIEPKTYNSGVPQGQLIRRHKIPLPEPCKGHYHTLEHFNVGCDVTLYAKVFHICACDGFTRKFLNQLGIPVPHNKELPRDCGSEKIKDRKASQFARKPHQCNDTRGPFIKHSGHVLRFWAYWDDRCKLYGDMRQFIIHYFLSDDTMEIREILRPNSGYEAYPMFLKKSKVPKKPENLLGLPGEKTPLTILNVFGSMYSGKNKKAHWMVDNMCEQYEEEFYKDKDLAIGAVLNIYGRPFILTRCDEFTSQYYKEKYCIEDFTPLVLNEELEREIPAPKPPPYHGWGQEDDLGMWKSLDMKPAVKDYRRQVLLDKDILRFEAKFHNAVQSVNQTREFVINYYMADETIQIFEKENPTSGLPKGKFLLRCKVKKPGYRFEVGDQPEYYETKDLFVGGIININGFDFELTGADEFTLCYMEAHSDMFPQSNIALCLEKIRGAFGPHSAEDVLKCFSETDPALEGVIDAPSFRCKLLEISKGLIAEHELMTLTRGFAAKPPLVGTDFSVVQAVAQTELRRCLFDRILLSKIEYTLRYHDQCRTGKVDRETLRASLKGAKLPIFKELLDYLVDKFPTAKDDPCNRIDYCDFMRFLDWEHNPAPIASPSAIKQVMKCVEPQPPMKIEWVNYRAFLEEVCPLIKSALPSLCCCENQEQSCPQHPPKCSDDDEPTDYCPKEGDSCEKKEDNICPPQETVNVFLQPCSITATESNQHKCAPGAQKCFASQQDDREYVVPSEPTDPCGGPATAKRANDVCGNTSGVLEY